MLSKYIKGVIQKEKSTFFEIIEGGSNKNVSKSNKQDKKSDFNNKLSYNNTSDQREIQNSKTKDSTTYRQGKTTSIKKVRKNLQEYLDELNKSLIDDIKKQWLTPKPNKKYLSVTEVIGCPLQVWFKLSGNLKEEDIEEDKIFSLLPLYGKIGDVLHDEIYKRLQFEHVEKFFSYDTQNYLMGKFDIIDSTFLIDLKTSRNVDDHSAQLSLYLHLARKSGYHITKVAIWYVLRNEIVEYDIKDLENKIPVYLSRSRLIKKHLELKTPPPEVDEKYCKYCLIQNKCKQAIQTNEYKQTLDNKQTQAPNDDIILTFDINL